MNCDMKYKLITLLLAVCLFSCVKEDDIVKESDRTILVYMAAENSFCVRCTSYLVILCTLVRSLRKTQAGMGSFGEILNNDFIINFLVDIGTELMIF